MTLKEIDGLKRVARRMVKTSGMKQHEALDTLAQAKGFKNWALLMKSYSEQDNRGNE